MNIKLRLSAIGAAILLVSLLAACVSAPPGDAGDSQGSSSSGSSSGSGPTLSSEGFEGKLYMGDLGAPRSDKAALYITNDFKLEFLMVDDKSLGFSAYMEGTLNGQTIVMQDDRTGSRGQGRSAQVGVELNLTFPGQGLVRSVVTVVDAGALFKGELNGFTAGLIVLSDGSVYGIAAGEGGDDPVMEYLCVDGTADPTASEIVAKTCDTDQEVTLTNVVK